MCLNETEKPVWAAKRYKGRISDMRGIEGEVPESHTWVMGLLSVMKTIRCPAQWWPHVKVAAVIANNSL